MLQLEFVAITQRVGVGKLQSCFDALGAALRDPVAERWAAGERELAAGSCSQKGSMFSAASNTCTRITFE